MSSKVFWALVIGMDSIFLLFYAQNIQAPSTRGDIVGEGNKNGDLIAVEDTGNGISTELPRENLESWTTEVSTKPTCGVSIAWNEEYAARGSLISVKTGEKYTIVHPGGQSARVEVAIPPGQYRIQMEDGVAASPKEFFVASGLVDVACYPGNTGQLKVTRNGVPIFGVSVLAKSRSNQPWSILGDTDPEGNLSYSGLGKVGMLFFYKAKAVLGLARFPRGISGMATPLIFDAGSPEEFKILVLDENTGEGIQGAKIKIGPYPLAISNIDGLARMEGKGEPWLEMEVSAEGYLSSADIVHDITGSENVVIAKLAKKGNTILTVIASDGENLSANAHILVFDTDSSGAPKMVWEGTSSSLGEVIMPGALVGQLRIVAYHKEDGFASLKLLDAIESQRITLEKSPPLEIQSFASNGEVVSLRTCIAKTYWGESLAIQETERGSVEVFGAVGAKTIQFEDEFGSPFVLGRSRGFLWKTSLVNTDVIPSLTGVLECFTEKGFEVKGFITSTSSPSLETRPLEICFLPEEQGQRNFEQWPDLGGARPSNLVGWVWKDQAVKNIGLIMPNGTFTLSGLAEGRNRVQVKDLSRDGARLNVEFPQTVYIPTDGDIPVRLEDSIYLNLKIRDFEGGPIKNPILEYTGGSTFDLGGSNNVMFYSSEFQYSLPASQALRIQVLAKGYEPSEVVCGSVGSVADVQTIRLKRVLPMRVFLEDRRMEPDPLSLQSTFGRYETALGIMMPMLESRVNFDEQGTGEILGPFPGCDVFLSVIFGKVGALAPSSFQYVPGGEVRVILEDSSED